MPLAQQEIGFARAPFVGLQKTATPVAGIEPGAQLGLFVGEEPMVKFVKVQVPIEVNADDAPADPI